MHTSLSLFILLVHILVSIPFTFCQSPSSSSSLQLNSDVSVGFIGTYPLWLLIGIGGLVVTMFAGFAFVSWRNIKGNPEVPPSKKTVLLNSTTLPAPLTPFVNEPEPISSPFISHDSVSSSTTAFHPLKTIEYLHPISILSTSTTSPPSSSSQILSHPSQLSMSLTAPSNSSTSPLMPHPPSFSSSTPSMLTRSLSTPSTTVPAYIQPSSTKRNLSLTDQRILAWSQTVPTTHLPTTFLSPLSLPVHDRKTRDGEGNEENERGAVEQDRVNDEDDEEDTPLALSRSGSCKNSIRSVWKLGPNEGFHGQPLPKTSDNMNGAAFSSHLPSQKVVDPEEDDENWPLGLSPASLAVPH
ncbi:hypothetical protein HMI54_012177 [Coelomomyces lativittatus]|nr:hypothetical protein HMI54_012177 [Coelomomyces lativittatus]KAJ1509708.1 hypothetical protein HMI56_006663 [Coelomomyces lativittatus]